MDNQDLPTPKPAPRTDHQRREADLGETEPRPATPPPEVSIQPIGQPNRWVRLLIIILVLALLGAAAYYGLFIRNKNSAKSGNNSQTGQNSQSTPLSSNSKIDSATKHYDSTVQNMGFDYPADWTVKEDANVLTATSPVMKLTDNTGQAANGEVIFTIRQKGQSVSEFDSGSAVAVQDSQKIAYTKPSPAQRANTYVSFVRYASSMTNSFDGVYVTGDYGYKVDQAIPKVDIVKLDPLLSVTFRRCTDSNCANGTSLSISPETWKSLSAPILVMLKSLTVS